jgi:tetratricopeptide (TPR) repeat protein
MGPGAAVPLLALALGLVAPALAVDMDRAAELYQSSYTLEANGNYRSALAQVEALAGEGEDTYTLHLRRGWLLYNLGRYEDAAKAYRAAIDKEPTSVEARQGLALPLMALKQWKEAESVCRDLLSRAAGDKTGRGRLAYILYMAGRYGEAAREYEAVLEAHPSDADMRAGLGWALLKEGKVKDARAAFEAVLRVAPAHRSAQTGLEASR